MDAEVVLSSVAMIGEKNETVNLSDENANVNTTTSTTSITTSSSSSSIIIPTPQPIHMNVSISDSCGHARAVDVGISNPAHSNPSPNPNTHSFYQNQSQQQHESSSISSSSVDEDTVIATAIVNRNKHCNDSSNNIVINESKATPLTPTSQSPKLLSSNLPSNMTVTTRPPSLSIGGVTSASRGMGGIVTVVGGGIRNVNDHCINNSNPNSIVKPSSTNSISSSSPPSSCSCSLSSLVAADHLHNNTNHSSDSSGSNDSNGSTIYIGPLLSNVPMSLSLSPRSTISPPPPPLQHQSLQSHSNCAVPISNSLGGGSASHLSTLSSNSNNSSSISNSSSSPQQQRSYYSEAEVQNFDKPVYSNTHHLTITNNPSSSCVPRSNPIIPSCRTSSDNTFTTSSSIVGSNLPGTKKTAVSRPRTSTSSNISHLNGSSQQQRKLGGGGGIAAGGGILQHQSNLKQHKKRKLDSNMQHGSISNVKYTANNRKIVSSGSGRNKQKSLSQFQHNAKGGQKAMSSGTLGNPSQLSLPFSKKRSRSSENSVRPHLKESPRNLKPPKKKMNPAEVDTELNNRSAAELQRACIFLDLPYSGRKCQLIQRLVGAGSTFLRFPSIEEIARSDTSQLVQLCEERDLEKTGSRSKMIERLVACTLAPKLRKREKDRGTCVTATGALSASPGTGIKAENQSNNIENIHTSEIVTGSSNIGSRNNRTQNRRINVDQVLKASGVVDVENVAWCIKAAIHRHFITINGPQYLDQFIIKDFPCGVCGTPISARLRDILFEKDYGGYDYELQQYCPVRCHSCGAGFYVTNICSGKPVLDSGKFHNHCRACKSYGNCIGDYRESHCSNCNDHYHAGSMGQFPCPNCHSRNHKDEFQRLFMLT